MTSAEHIDKTWPDDAARVPNWIYSDPDLFEREMQEFHEGDSWHYIGLECEVPERGSYKRSWIGRRSVVMVHGRDGEIAVFDNRCPHRQSKLCWTDSGKFPGSRIMCPYHNWTFDLAGQLIGIPFLKSVGNVEGMPADFDKAKHGLKRLRTARRGGTVWATYDETARDFETFLGPEILRLFDRIFSGRKLKLLGYSRQSVPSNWKLYVDNLHDPYHATLLHTFIPTFGMWRADGDFLALPTGEGQHYIIETRYTKNLRDKENEITGQMNSIRKSYYLNDGDVVFPVFDDYDDLKNTAFHVFPSILIQQFLSCLSVRHIIPKDVGSHELSWTFFGYEDDSEELTETRLKQSNLVGPAGFISSEDAEIIAQMQPVLESSPESQQVIEMGGKDIVAKGNSLITEVMLRSFYVYYRKKMAL